jgi:DNA-directed RNA polymerase subunit RPC12/RpoP
MKLPVNSIIPPSHGDKIFFVCNKCGCRFRAESGILSILARCPECGSLNTVKDTMVKHYNEKRDYS